MKTDAGILQQKKTQYQTFLNGSQVEAATLTNGIDISWAQSITYYTCDYISITCLATNTDVKSLI